MANQNCPNFNFVMSNRRNVYVGGVDEKVTQEMIHSICIPFGDILDVQFPLDPKTGQHRGFAIVEFELIEDAEAAND